VLSRRGREAVEGIELVTGDLATGEGIDAAVEGSGIIVHCAGTSKGDEVKALNLSGRRRGPGRGTWCSSRSSAPSGLVPDFGGPRVYGMAELLRGYLRASSRYRLPMPVRLPGRAARAFRAGANLAPDRAMGRRTWEEFLADQVHSPTDSLAIPHGGTGGQVIWKLPIICMSSCSRLSQWNT
jgi:hypothetical protein